MIRSSILAQIESRPILGPLLHGQTARAEVVVNDPEHVRRTIKDAIALGATVGGEFDAANDQASVVLHWPGLTVWITVPDVGFDPDVVLLRLGVPYVSTTGQAEGR